MSGLNTNLTKARKEKNDEFYTQRTDIENELKHYKRHFAGKVVYCNCDDPRVSEFTRFFLAKFNSYGLSKLIATCYRNTNPDMFTLEAEEHGASIMVADAASAASGGVIETLDGDGDFRSPECIELLKEADIVVTNPPFSLFREYVASLMEHGKKFIIIGNMNAITYKEIFPLIKDDLLWYGPSISSGDREFGVPDDYPLLAAGHRVDDAGNKFIRIKGVRWFTNLDHNRRHEELLLWRRYADTPELFPRYDNYHAINVDATNDIPEDYEEPMGVPITFLDKHCPDQFEILGADYNVKDGLLPGIVNPDWNGKLDRGYLNGKRLYSRILIQRKAQP